MFADLERNRLLKPLGGQISVYLYPLHKTVPRHTESGDKNGLAGRITCHRSSIQSSFLEYVNLDGSLKAHHALFAQKCLTDIFYSNACLSNDMPDCYWCDHFLLYCFLSLERSHTRVNVLQRNIRNLLKYLHIPLCCAPRCALQEFLVIFHSDN